MKKFYKCVSTARAPGGYHILLDGRPVKMPGRESALLVAHEALAEALAAEWAAQGEEIIPAEMPLTQIAVTCQERIPRERKSLEKAVLQYLDTDLLCYRAAIPEAIARTQAALWDPWLAWFEKKFGRALATTTDLEALRQDREIHEIVKKYVDALDDEPFTILQIVTPLSGSLVLALAFIERAIGAEDLVSAARLEENYRSALYDEERHGRDPIEEKRQAAMARDLRAAAAFLEFAAV